MKILKLALPILIFVATLAGGLSTVQAQDPDLTDGLVAHWKLDETSDGSSSVTRNDSHGTNDLTDNNTVSSTIGLLGNAIVPIAGNNEYLFTLSMFDTAQSYSVALWHYPTADGSELVAIQSGILATIIGNRVLYTPESGSSLVWGTYSLNQWVFIVAMFDSETNTAYLSIDGTIVDSLAVTPTTQTGAFYLGRRPGRTAMYGYIDNVSIYNRTLTADEITKLYNNGNGLDYEDFPPDQTINVTVNLTPTIIVSPTFSLTPTIEISPTFNITNNVILTPTTPYTSITNPHTGNELHIQRVYTHGDIAIAVPLWFLLLLGVYWRIMIVTKGR
jgi:hypothetical protein